MRAPVAWRILMKLGPGLLFMPALMWLSVSPGCGADLDGEADEPADEAERPPIDRLTSDDEAGVLDELERWFSEIVPDPKAGSAEATSVTAAAVAPGECARYF